MQPRRSHRLDKRTLLPIAAGLLLAVLGLAAIGSVVAFQVMRKEALTDEILCPVQAKPVSHTIVLVDQSSTFTTTQIAVVRDTILRARDQTPDRGRLTLVYLNSGRPYEPREIFSRCNPGNGDDTDPWLDDPERVRRNWIRQFEVPLDEALKELASPAESETSPILETLQAIEWRPDFSRDQSARRLIVVSDMLQNSELFSLYSKTDRTYDDLLRRPQVSSRLAHLRNVRVEIRLLRGPTTVEYQDNQFVEFWSKYFAVSEAQLVGL